MFYYILWFFLHLFAFCFASRFFLHIPDTYPIHTRHIPDTYVYPTNTPWIPHEYPTNTPYLFLTYSKYRRMHTLKWKSAIFDTCQCPPNSLFLSLSLSIYIYVSLYVHYPECYSVAPRRSQGYWLRAGYCRHCRSFLIPRRGLTI